MDIFHQKLTNQFVLPLWNEKAIELIDQFFAPDADIQTTFLIGQGPSALKKSVADTFIAFPEFRVNIEDAIEYQKTLIYKWRAEVKHEGCILNIPPTGRKMIFCGTVYGKVKEGLIQVYHSFSNIPQVLHANFPPIYRTSSISESIIMLDNLESLVCAIEEILKVRFTKRELECLIFWLRGFSIKDTAKMLGGISNKTIQSFRIKIKQKLHISSFQDLIHLMTQSGLLNLLLQN